MLRAEPCARGSNFKVFDHPHLRHSLGRVWLLKFSSLLPHLSIATEAQNSHLGNSFFSSFTWRAGQYRLQNSWWHLREAPCGLLLRWMLLLSKLYLHYHHQSLWIYILHIYYTALQITQFWLVSCSIRWSDVLNATLYIRRVVWYTVLPLMTTNIRICVITAIDQWDFGKRCNTFVSFVSDSLFVVLYCIL